VLDQVNLHSHIYSALNGKPAKKKWLYKKENGHIIWPSRHPAATTLNFMWGLVKNI
jgi:hypothetical protein